MGSVFVSKKFIFRLITKRTGHSVGKVSLISRYSAHIWLPVLGKKKRNIKLWRPLTDAKKTSLLFKRKKLKNTLTSNRAIATDNKTSACLNSDSSLEADLAKMS